MTPEQAWLTALSGIVIALLSLLGVMYTAAKAQRSTDRSNQFGMVGPSLVRLTEAEAQITALWKAREEDAKVKRVMGDHIDTLEDHIWKGRPAPPPPRPEGI